ncbi:serine/threonine-protein kinase [Actinosynnema sp. NPDC050801]|uniref:serine/threonine-protein kinase n=1 Tax=unclassified Actinosynnema TaxID=2637065 RepID=UPI0033EDCF34
MVGRIIADRYRLEEYLGAGGMGEVWRATDLRLHETFALKRPGAGGARHEARIGAGLSHPNVITVHGTVSDGTEQWLVMEYLPSRSLAEIIEMDGPISPQRAAKIGAQVADALAAMHAKGMVHRDVKPGNILVTDNDVAKLSDFGISRWAEATRAGGGDVAGTAAYLAPEVADGHEARPASDVFALGATLFAAVEGTSPWGSPDAGSSEQLRRAKAYDITPAGHEGPFSDLLTRLMRRDPRDRPATENVRPLLEGLKLPNPRRRKAIVIGAAALVVLVVAGAVIYSRMPSPGTVGDPRTMDVCGLAATQEDYQRVDPHHVETSDVRSYWFNGCTSWVAFDEKGDEGVVVDYFVKQYVQYGVAKPKQELGPITQIGSTDKVCSKSIVLADGNTLQIDAKAGSGPGRALCEIAQEAGERAHAVLSDNPIPRRTRPWPEGSLANADACGLLKPENLMPQLKSEATPYPWNELGFWGCGWDYGLRHVEIEFSRQQPFDSGDGTVVDVGGGRLAYLDPEPDKGECQVKVRQRVAREGENERIEVVRVILSEENLAEGTTLCPGATELAKAVVANLPRTG